MAAPILQFKRGAFNNLPGLRAGEPGFTTDKYDLYVGLTSALATNKFFGSSRYWSREDGTNSLSLNLVDKDGTNSIKLKSPNVVSSGSTDTYTLPNTNTISDGYFLKVSTTGQLSWDTVGGSNGSFTNPTLTGITTISGSLNNTASTTNSGITTFTNTTDNTLGNSNTGAVQIDGGVGIDKNLTVGANLHVQGFSNFVGVVTFQGGTINLGDSNTDNINVAGEFISNLTPNTDNTYDIGISTQRWRHAAFSGVGTFATGAVIDAVQIGITATNEIDTTSGNLILDSAAGTVEIQDQLTVSGITTLTGLLDANGGASIDNIQIGVTGDNIIDTSTGNLTISSATNQTIIDDNLSVTGIATVTGAFVANGNVTLGDAAGDTITINGTTTFNQPLVGTIGTATRALTVDTTTAPSGTFYPGLFVNNTGTASTAVYVDAGISYVSNTDTLTLTGDIAVNGGDVTTSATTFNLVNGTATSVNFAGAATALVMGAATGITTVSNNLTVAGDVRINGNDIQASDGNANITLTSNTLTAFAGDIRVNGNDIQASDGNANITMTSNTLTAFAGDIRVNGNDIQSSTGANVITLSTNNATFANDVTVSGNLYVNGSTTQVNTNTLTVEDRTIELGLVGGASTTTSTWDLAVLFNYGDAGTAKKSAVVWENTVKRFQFGSALTTLGGDTNGSDVSTPQIDIGTANFAPIEVGSLWMNDTAGQSVVASYLALGGLFTGSEAGRYLQNITVDAGTF